MIIRFIMLVMALSGLGCASTQFSYRGYAAAEGRVFFQPAKHSRQSSGNSVSLVMEPEFRVQSKKKSDQGILRGFIRLDSVDDQRSHYDLRRAEYRHNGKGWHFGGGVGQFSWGALYHHRIVDVVNQVDFVENLDEDSKLGQLYLGGGWGLNGWSLEAYYLPLFRNKTFPGIKGRPRPQWVVDTQRPAYELSLGRLYPSAAARLGASLGAFDVNLSGYHGLSHEPQFIVQIGQRRVSPRYVRLSQASFDGRATFGPFAVSAEVAARWWTTESKFSPAASGGLDYTFYDMNASGVDLTFIGEYYFDFRRQGLPFTLIDNDAFVGFRLAINDPQQTEFRGGVMTDVVSAFSFVGFGIKRRIRDKWVIGLEGNLFLGGSDNFEAAFLTDNYVFMSLSYFF